MMHRPGVAAPGVKPAVDKRRRKARSCVMAARVLTMLAVASAGGSIAAIDVDRPTLANAAGEKTGKERLSDKASDEQRMNDCKVPEARRTRIRPTNCPSDVGS